MTLVKSSIILPRSISLRMSYSMLNVLQNSLWPWARSTFIALSQHLEIYLQLSCSSTIYKRNVLSISYHLHLQENKWRRLQGAHIQFCCRCFDFIAVQWFQLTQETEKRTDVFVVFQSLLQWTQKLNNYWKKFPNFTFCKDNFVCVWNMWRPPYSGGKILNRALLSIIY